MSDDYSIEDVPGRGKWTNKKAKKSFEGIWQFLKSVGLDDSQILPMLKDIYQLSISDHAARKIKADYNCGICGTETEDLLYLDFHETGDFICDDCQKDEDDQYAAAVSFDGMGDK